MIVFTNAHPSERKPICARVLSVEVKSRLLPCVRYVGYAGAKVVLRCFVSIVVPCIRFVDTWC